jgi:hypothetical protein
MNKTLGGGGGGRRKKLFNQGQCGKLSKQLLRTFSSPCHDVKIVCNYGHFEQRLILTFLTLESDLYAAQTVLSRSSLHRILGQVCNPVVTVKLCHAQVF